MQRRSNNLFIIAWAIRLGGVDKVYAERDGTLQQTNPTLPIGIRAKVAGLSGQAHRAVAKPMHGQIATYGIG
jgi:hypothetical protein